MLDFKEMSRKRCFDAQKSILDLDYMHMFDLKSYEHYRYFSQRPTIALPNGQMFSFETLNFSSVASDHHIPAAAASQYDCNL